MAPSKSTAKEIKSDRRETKEGLKATTEAVRAAGTSPVNQNGVARSPSGLSLSRPQSLFAPSTRTTGLSAPGAISPSPSSRNLVDRTSVTATSASRQNVRSDGGGLNVGESSAMGRLRRVASNASIASSIRPRQNVEEESQAAGANSNTIVEGNEGDDSTTQQNDAGKEVKGESDIVDSRNADADDAKMADPTIPKRPLDENADTIKGKQAKRWTWFGYVSTEDGDVNAAEGTGASEMVDGEESASTTNTLRARPKAQADDTQNKSWLPWRAPTTTEPVTSASQEANTQMDENDVQTSMGDAIEPPASYTDSVRRYISWGSQQVFGTAPTSPNAGWGWSNWRAASAQTGDDRAVDLNGQTNGRHTRNLSDEEAHKAGAKAIVEAEGAQAIELDMSKQPHQNQNTSDIEISSTPVAASPAQASFIYRWMPSWGKGAEPTASQAPSDADTSNEDVQSSHQQPTTPAEQYKAEALKHLGAKDAILNTATRSTWINYFSSRAAAPSQRMDHRDIEEPEVMRIEAGDPAKTDKSMKPPNGVPARLAVKPSDSGRTTPADAQSMTGSVATSGTKGVGGAARDAVNKGSANADPAPAQSRPATPLTKNKEMAKQVVNAAQKQKDAALASATAASSKTGKAPVKVVAPNLLLPSFEDTFTAPPRSTPLKTGVWEKTMSILFSKDSNKQSGSTNGPPSSFSKGPPDSVKAGHDQARLPRLWSTMGDKDRATTKGCKDVRKVTVIGIHGWFSQGPIRNLFGEPTGTSSKFATMMTDAIKQHFHEAGVSLNDESITSIALQADGLVSDRVDKSFAALLANPKWVKDLASSDAIFVAAHSQGSIVATHLLARLVEQRHVDTRRSRTVLLCMCGIHNGPFAHLRGSISSYYMSTFETPAARELFEFQNGQSPVSRLYAASLRIVCAAGIKLVYVASLDDQVVPLFSALHTSASHPSMLRAIFCDGAAFPRVDFLTNLLSFCVNVRNAGLWDHHLVTLLSSSVAGSLYGGLGHSLVYDDVQVYSLAVRYLFEVSSPLSWPTAKTGRAIDETSIKAAGAPTGITASFGVPALDLDDEFTVSRNQKWNSNPYSLPWSLRGLLEDNLVRHYFSAQIDKLIKDYMDWQPSTKTLKDVQFRLEPMRFIANEVSTSKTGKSTSSQQASTNKTSNSKL